MTRLLNNLVKLQEIELASKRGANDIATRTELRAIIPKQILEHYDRLMARGKKGIVPVRNQNCGRYLYLPPEEASAAPQAKAKRKKPAGKHISPTLG